MEGESVQVPRSPRSPDEAIPLARGQPGVSSPVCEVLLRPGVVLVPDASAFGVVTTATSLHEAAADQDLHGGTDVGQGAVDADRVAGDAEPAHVVEGHRA